MKILFIAPEYHPYGGTEKSIYELSQHISGTETVDIMTAARHGTGDLSAGFFRVPRFPRIPVLKFLSFRVFSDLILFYRQRLNHVSYDIIHSTSADNGYANVVTAHFCMKKYRMLRARLVSWSSCKNPKRLLSEISIRIYMSVVSFMENRIYNHSRTKRIIAVSNLVKRDLIEQYSVPQEKISVVYDGVDPERFSPRSKSEMIIAKLAGMGMESGVPIILFAGGEWERKGLTHLFQAFRELDRKDVQLIILGHGDPSCYTEFIHQDEDKKPRVHFIPFDKNIEEWYAAADILVLPSLYEPFGMVVLEAMSSGLPVITTGFAGVSEIIKNEQDGIVLASPDNTRELADKLQELLSNPEKLAEMGVRAREKALSYSWNNIARETLEVYRTII